MSKLNKKNIAVIKDINNKKIYKKITINNKTKLVLYRHSILNLLQNQIK
jgi:hypothetical protein